MGAMQSRNATRSVALFALLAAAGCSAPVMPGDGGDAATDTRADSSRPDGQPPADVVVSDTTVDDVLSPSDSGIDDSAAPDDTGVDPDAGITPMDSGTSTDSGVVSDSGVLADSRVTDTGVDSGTRVDSGIDSGADSGVRTDSGVDTGTDSGTRPDTGVDTGVVVDSGVGMLCGNGRMDPGEECDDNNTTRWDGCSHLCRLEQTARADTISIIQSSAMMRVGCDLTGDGVADNRLGEAITDLAITTLNNSLRDSVNAGQTNVLAHFMDLDDRTGRTDPMIRLAFFTGADAMMPFQNVAGESFTIPRAELTPALDPLTPFAPAALNANALTGGPGTIVMRINLAGALTPLTLYRGQVSGTTTTNAMLNRIERINNGRICGALTAGDLDRIPWPSGLPGTCAVPTAPPPMGSPYSLLDMLAGGCNLIASIRIINPIQPDIDVAGDGLPAGMGTPARQLRDTNGDRVVDTCYDSSANTVITGANCAQDARMDDAISAAMNFTALRVLISGLR